MPSQNVTLASSGGDYSTLSSWESGEQQNLITAAYIHTVTCSAFEDDSAGCNIAGWTVNASYYITIQGAVDLAFPFSTSGAYTFRPSTTTTGSYGLIFGVAYTRVYDFQMYLDSAWTGYGVTFDVANCVVDSFILKADGANATTAYLCTHRQTSGTNTFSNFLVWSDPAGMGLVYGFYLSAGTPVVNAYNCAVVSSGAETGFGFNRGTGTMNLYNCVAFNFSTAGRDYSGTITSNYCATDQASGSSGITGDTGAVFEITNSWTSLSTCDLSWSSFAALEGQGANYDSITTVDILGTSRAAAPGAWSIGVFEPIPAQTVTGIIASAAAAVIAPSIRTRVTVTAGIVAAAATAIQNASLSGAQYITGRIVSAAASVISDVIVNLAPWRTVRTKEDSWSDASPDGDGWTDANPQTDTWSDQ